MYPINKHDGIYTFETKNGNKYRCSFTQSPDGLYGVEVKSEVIYFEFALTHIVSKKYDKNIKLTIVDLLHRVFCNKPNVIIGFICSDADNKAITRLQTFYRKFYLTSSSAALYTCFFINCTATLEPFTRKFFFRFSKP